jgi:hypothetical protein
MKRSQLKDNVRVRRAACTAMAVGVILLPAAGFAAEPAKPGATVTVNVQITTQEHGKTDTTTTTINRVLKGQCLMEAQAAMQVGMKGVSAEQQAALDQSNANAEAFTKEYAPSEELTNQIATAAEKCGDDEACMMAMVQQLAGNSEIQNMAKKKDKAIAAMSGLQPDLGPMRYQQWQPKQCSGTITANDTIDVNDPGGEGGAGAYHEITKIQGSVPAGPDWHGMVIETDLVAGTTTYQMMPVPPVTMSTTSSLNGAGQQQINLILETPMPASIGPLKGVLGKQSTTLKGPSGTLGIAWQASR